MSNYSGQCLREKAPTRTRDVKEPRAVADVKRGSQHLDPPVAVYSKLGAVVKRQVGVRINRVGLRDVDQTQTPRRGRTRLVVKRIRVSLVWENSLGIWERPTTYLGTRRL